MSERKEWLTLGRLLLDQPGFQGDLAKIGDRVHVTIPDFGIDGHYLVLVSVRLRAGCRGRYGTASAVSEGVDMNSPAATHFTISPEEWMNLSKVALWHDYGDPGLLHNIIDEYADALISQRVAVVRPTRDRVHAIIRQCVIDYCHEIGGNVGFPTAIIDDSAKAIAREFGVAVSDSQETPT